MQTGRIVYLISILGVVLALSGCGTWAGPVGALAGVSLTSVAVIQRGPADLVSTLVVGRDCSVVRLDKQESYCAPPETPPRLPYCTHSLGVVDCWGNPLALGRLPPRPVGDAPALTALQEQDLRRSWIERELGLTLGF